MSISRKRLNMRSHIQQVQLTQSENSKKSAKSLPASRSNIVKEPTSIANRYSEELSENIDLSPHPDTYEQSLSQHQELRAMSEIMVIRSLVSTPDAECARRDLVEALDGIIVTETILSMKIEGLIVKAPLKGSRDQRPLLLSSHNLTDSRYAVVRDLLDRNCVVRGKIRYRVKQFLLMNSGPGQAFYNKKKIDEKLAKKAAEALHYFNKKRIQKKRAIKAADELAAQVDSSQHKKKKRSLSKFPDPYYTNIFLAPRPRPPRGAR